MLSKKLAKSEIEAYEAFKKEQFELWLKEEYEEHKKEILKGYENDYIFLINIYKNQSLEFFEYHKSQLFINKKGFEGIMKKIQKCYELLHQTLNNQEIYLNKMEQWSKTVFEVSPTKTKLISDNQYIEALTRMPLNHSSNKTNSNSSERKINSGNHIKKNKKRRF